MAYIFFVGLVAALLAGAVYLVINKKSVGEYELSWKKCILTGFLVYTISLFLGALFTSVFQNVNRGSLDDILVDIVLHTFGILFYAILFSFFLVFPLLVLGLKFLSKTGLTNGQKQLGFAGLSFLLVLIMNALMTDFFRNADFMFFLAGFSFFGVAIPLYFARRVFKDEAIVMGQ